MLICFRKPNACPDETTILPHAGLRKPVYRFRTNFLRRGITPVPGRKTCPRSGGMAGRTPSAVAGHPATAHLRIHPGQHEPHHHLRNDLPEPGSDGWPGNAQTGARHLLGRQPHAIRHAVAVGSQPRKASSRVSGVQFPRELHGNERPRGSPDREMGQPAARRRNNRTHGKSCAGPPPESGRPKR